MEKYIWYLLKYYKDCFPIELDGTEILKYNTNNNLSDYYNELVKRELIRYV